MTNLLRKLFIKNYKDTANPKIRQKHGFLASFVGIFTNLFLFAFKLIIGIAIFSMSIITDAINNLTDMASCIINLIGFKISGKPADKEHPFGHERIEYIAGLIVSLVIIAIAIVLGYTSVMKIINHELTDYANPLNNIFTFVILGVAILTKLWQGLFYKKISNAINSVSLKASSQDSINDVISTSCVLIATIVEFILAKNNIKVQIDGWAGIGCSIFIIVMGIKMVLETSNPLIGVSPDNEMVKTIVGDICKYEGVLGVHDLMVHSYGPTKLFIVIHVEVDYKIDVLKSHDLVDNIESEISKKYNVILTIHMDPIVTDSKIINSLKNKTHEMLESYDSSLKFHDFRVVEGETHTNVLFDILRPYDCKHTEEEIREFLIAEYKKINKKYNLVIKIDNDYVG